MTGQVSVHGIWLEPSVINPGKQDYLMVPVLFNLLHAAMLDYATRDLRVNIIRGVRADGYSTPHLGLGLGEGYCYPIS